MTKLAVMPAQEIATSPADPVAVLLHRMHVEMIALAEGVMAVQTALSSILASAHGSITCADIREAQKLDLIEQTLRALADIATQASVSSEAGPLDLHEITKICRLTDLADRLRGGPSGRPAADADLELF